MVTECGVWWCGLCRRCGCGRSVWEVCVRGVWEELVDGLGDDGSVCGVGKVRGYCGFSVCRRKHTRRKVGID